MTLSLSTYSYVQYIQQRKFQCTIKKSLFLNLCHLLEDWFKFYIPTHLCAQKSIKPKKKESGIFLCQQERTPSSWMLIPYTYFIVKAWDRERRGGEEKRRERRETVYDKAVKQLMEVGV